MRVLPWSSCGAGFACSFAILNGIALAYAPLSDDALHRVSRPTSEDFDIHNGALLAPILIPRVPGSTGSVKAQHHFLDFFRHSLPEWNVTFQNSTQKTALGYDLPFINIVAARDPPWTTPGDVGRLTLVAHYDSLITPVGFIGAIDSAAPCAMILHAVRAIDAALTRKWDAMQAEGVDTFDGMEEHKGIQVLFLDGEEAFVSWSDTDSIYGARSLAEAWEQDYHPAMSSYKNKLESIELFVLLDLLGSTGPSIPSYFKTTHWAYQNMANLEQRMRDLNLFVSAKTTNWLPDGGKNAHVATQQFPSYWMQDDHIPFMARGVQVLHLIPSSFPDVWHKITDDGEHLDIPTVEDWALLTAAFAAEWLELGDFLEMPTQNVPRVDKRSENVVISKTEL